jgi:hypothetical protein
MEERDHYLSRQYHQHLLTIAASERLACSTEVHSPGRVDHLLERSGDLLISLGQALKNRALKNHTAAPDLSGECV